MGLTISSHIIALHFPRKVKQAHVIVNPLIMVCSLAAFSTANTEDYKYSKLSVQFFSTVIITLYIQWLIFNIYHIYLQKNNFDIYHLSSDTTILLGNIIKVYIVFMRMVYVPEKNFIELFFFLHIIALLVGIFSGVPSAQR